MTPAEAEALLIELWNQGLEIAAIAQRLGIPKGTVQSRAHRLQQRGSIQPRPKGGAYPKQRAKARQEDPLLGVGFFMPHGIRRCSDERQPPTPQRGAPARALG